MEPGHRFQNIPNVQKLTRGKGCVCPLYLDKSSKASRLLSASLAVAFAIKREAELSGGTEKKAH